MGDLIVMSRSTPQPARAFFAGHHAEILFFTGVRYYRMDEAAEPISLPAGKRVVRRRPSAEKRVASKRLVAERRIEALA